MPLSLKELNAKEEPDPTVHLFFVLMICDFQIQSITLSRIINRHKSYTFSFRDGQGQSSGKSFRNEHDEIFNPDRTSPLCNRSANCGFWMLVTLWDIKKLNYEWVGRGIGTTHISQVVCKSDVVETYPIAISHEKFLLDHFAKPRKSNQDRAVLIWISRSWGCPQQAHT